MYFTTSVDASGSESEYLSEAPVNTSENTREYISECTSDYATFSRSYYGVDAVGAAALFVDALWSIHGRLH